MPKVNDNGINRDMTLDETTAYENWAKQQEADSKIQREADEARAAARAAALNKLGLTAEEIAALFG
jgi:Holliday junction resolvasome RuvABC DNA-binding subunit